MTLRGKCRTSGISFATTFGLLLWAKVCKHLENSESLLKAGWIESIMSLEIYAIRATGQRLSVCVLQVGVMEATRVVNIAGQKDC